MRHTGRSLARLDAVAAAAGRVRHAADIRRPRELALRLVRSPVAAGQLRAVDTAAAAAMPGVRAVLTAADLPLPPLPAGVGTGAGLEAFLQPVLAVGAVRFVGEPVAAVLADTAGAAEDAAELVDLDIVPATPQLSTQTPPGAPDGRATEAVAVRTAIGDLHSAFHAADRIVETRVTLSADVPLVLEPRAGLAEWDPGSGSLTLWTVARPAHATCETLASMLGLPRAAVRVETFARGGGGFLLEELAPEDVLLAYAARLTGRPVRWEEDRREALLAGAQGRNVTAAARAAVNADGTLLGLDVDYTVDGGAYVRPAGLAVPGVVGTLLAGPYRPAAVRAHGRLRMTNRPPAGGLRTAGQIEATFVRERVLDAVAAAVGLSPMDVRRRNLVPPAPPSAHGAVAPPGQPAGNGAARYEALVDAATKRFGLDGLRRRCAERRDRGEMVGLGQALFVDAAAGGGFEAVALSVDRGGHVELLAGIAPDGAGAATELAQIVADVLGVDYRRVRVTFGDTRRIAFSPGAPTSGALLLVASAAQYAAEALRERIVDSAASLMGVGAHRLTIASGRIREADRHYGATLDLGALAAALEPGALGVSHGIGGLSADGLAYGDATSVPYGLAAALVEIDPQTGIVRVPRGFVAYEAGNAINPALVEQRLAAGAVEGVFGALHAERPVSPAGDPLRGNLADHALPTAADLPAIETLVLDEAPAPDSPLGLRGFGDGSVSGMTAAVAAAVDAALSTPGFATALPIRPSDVMTAVTARRRLPVS